MEKWMRQLFPFIIFGVLAYSYFTGWNPLRDAVPKREDFIQQNDDENAGGGAAGLRETEQMPAAIEDHARSGGGGGGYGSALNAARSAGGSRGRDGD